MQTAFLTLFILILQRLHELFSVFMFYDDSMSRPLRLNLVFLKYQIVMSLSSVFAGVSELKIDPYSKI